MACLSPPQQLISIKIATAPNHTSRLHRAQADEPGDPNESDDCGGHQAARTAQHEPEEGAKDLAAVQWVDGQDIENQQPQVNIRDRRTSW